MSGSRHAAFVALALCLLASPFLTPHAHAQTIPGFDPGDLDDMSQALQVVGDRYAQRYVQPVSDAFGAGVNAGLFRTADVSGGLVPFVDVYLGVSASGALMASSDRHFLPQAEELNIDGQRVTIDYRLDGEGAPTAFGDTDSPGEAVITVGEESFAVELPPGLVNTPVAPLVIPQLGVGSLLGTDAQLRYLPETRLKGYGTVGLFGLALRHSLSQYIPLSPVDIAVQGAWNRFSLKDRNIAGEVIEASGWAVNLQVSRSVGPAAVYGGLQYERFNVDARYTFSTDGLPGVSAVPSGAVTIDFEQTAANKVRGLAGMTFTLALVRFNLDYALSANDTFTLGLGVKL